MEGLSSARPEAALGIPDLAFDDRVQDCAEGRQLGEGRAALRGGGQGRQRLQLAGLALMA
jgi:hypothetical protein